MGFFNWVGNKLIGADGSGAKNAMEGAGTLAKDLRSAITGEIAPEKKAELALKTIEIEAKLHEAQAEINKVEAGSTRFFVAAWRPFIGWTGGITLFSHFVLKPWIEWGISLWGSTPIELPAMDLTGIYPIIIGILGLGGMRSWEKNKNINNKH